MKCFLKRENIMLVKVKSVANYGINPFGVDVEVNVATRGLPAFDIVGLADKAVAESKERVKTALVNSNFDFPSKRVTINLAPADKPKEGTFFDLPIAIGIVCAISNIEIPKSSLFYGELSLDGTVRHVKGALLAALYANENNIKNLYIPKSCVKEATVIKNINVFGIECLSQIFDHLMGYKILTKETLKLNENNTTPNYLFDFASILGQCHAKRALEIAAAGGHNVLMSGVPGSGKTMMAKAFGSILPALTTDESIEVTKIYSSAGETNPNQGLITKRPYRAPHHTTSYAGLIGGGSYPKPGEISLAHRGVLFLDEFSEFSKYILESLRQPLEEGTVTISRSLGSATYPAKFILIAATNPCPCGYFGSNTKPCTCSQFQINRYSKKISGPILDRIDLFTKVNAVDVKELNKASNKHTNEERSIDIKKRVQAARDIQIQRFKHLKIYTNSEMENTHISKFCVLDNACLRLLNMAVKKFNMSARAYFKTIKTARTIADLKETASITEENIAEALQYRYI